MATTTKISWGGGEVTGRLTGDGGIGVLLAHGAGTNQDHPSIATLRNGLATAHKVMTFNYPYTERGAKRPDRAERLLECHRVAANYLRGEVDELYLAGRSMGGRIATHVVAEGDIAAGVVLYAYPLHPAGKPEKLRVAHLGDVVVPLLFFQGTRDALSRMELFDEHIRPLPNTEVEILEGAGHGYRGGGWTMESITERYIQGTLGWIVRHSSGTRSKQQP